MVALALEHMHDLTDAVDRDPSVLGLAVSDRHCSRSTSALSPDCAAVSSTYDSSGVRSSGGDSIESNTSQSHQSPGIGGKAETLRDSVNRGLYR